MSSCTFIHEQKTLVEKRRKTKQWLGKEIILPDTLKTIYKGVILKTNDFSLVESKYKIVTRIWGNCHVCVDELNNWKPFLDSCLINHEISFLCYINVYNFEFENFLEYMYPAIKLDYPLFIDFDNIFINTNQIFIDDQDLHTMLLDSMNRVVIIGSPIKSKEMKQLYLKYFEFSKND